MSSSTGTNNNVQPSEKPASTPVNSLAVVSPPSDVESPSPSSSSDSSSGEFVTRPKVYRPFKPTFEWQDIDDDHLLPPGLWIQMDMDRGKAQARLPDQPVNRPASASSSSTSPATDEIKSTNSDKPTEEARQSKQDTNSSQGLIRDISTNLSSTSPATPSTGPKRGFSTVAAPSRKVKSVDSSASRPIVYPTFPKPSVGFLSARAPMPVAPTPIISIAPMVDVSDRHFRYLMRLITKHTVLYTPMIVDNALIRAPHAHPLYVKHQAIEYPMVAQLGGSEAETLVKAARICEAQGFQQININCGCPAPSASGHAYGCVLMNNPDFPLSLRALTESVNIPVTVKCRIGLNKEESFEYFCNFIERCWKIGRVDRFIVHARKAVLNLKTSKNLTVPPLKYDFVYRLKEKYPQLHIEINGGFDDWDTVKQQMEKHNLQGVMLGRLAWKNPYAFSQVDRTFYGSTEEPKPRSQIMELYLQYAEREWEDSQNNWRDYENRKQQYLDSVTQSQLQTSECKEDGNTATLRSVPTPVMLAKGARHGCHAASLPSELHPPYELDIRTLLKPVGYLYANEPGYKKFRLKYEEGLLNKSWSMRDIINHAMSAVEPPPLREWGVKDPGFEYSQQAIADLEEAARRKLCNAQQIQADDRFQQNHTANEVIGSSFISLNSVSNVSEPGANLLQ